MRIYDIIQKKRDNKQLNMQEIEFVINGYVNGEIEDYQMSAFLMAVYFNGMQDEECANFTKCMLNSGETMDLSEINGIKVDKHSTGGVGDKTTLIVAPIVAACGAKVAKMSGRGLGHTGGTIDKLESISRVKLDLPKERFFEIVNKVGGCIVSQSGNLVPADKKIYALRDVTATVESMPLIASSIMSKKLASGADCILLDVKVGSGAFMKTKEDAINLSKIMVNIGEHCGKKVVAIITDMNEPLGNAIGNAIEVWEVCKVLKGEGPKDLNDICLCLASNMLYLANKGTIAECEKMVLDSIKSGKALEKFKEMIAEQGGNLEKFIDADSYNIDFKVKHEVFLGKNGYVSSMDTEKIGKSAMALGAGRKKKEDKIDYGAGIMLNKKIGDKISENECFAELYSSSLEKCLEAENILKEAVITSQNSVQEKKLIKAKVVADEVEIF